MASQYAELGKQNNTQFNYVLPSGEVIPAGINPDKAATVDLKGVLQGTVASNVPQAILDLAKQQYTPTRMAVANTDLRTASGEIIKAGSEFDIMGKGSLTPVDAMSAKGAYWTETGKSGSDYVTPSPNATPNVFNAPPASPETQKANVLTATGTTQEQLNANEAANLKYTPTPQNVNIPGNKQMTAGEIGAGLDTAKQEALAIQAKLAEMKKLDTEANAEAEKEATALSDTNVDLSDSSKLIAALTKTIGGTEAPKTPSLAEEFSKQRATLGLGDLETQLNNANAQIAKLDADWQATEAEESGRLVSMGQIKKRQSALGIEYTKQRAALVAEQTTLTNQLNMKYGVLETMMTLTGKDYDNAQQDYQNKFTNAINLANLMRGITNDEKDAIQKKQDNTLANLQIYWNLFQSGGIAYDNLSTQQKMDIRNSEIQLGPGYLGITKLITKTVKEPVVSTLAAFTDKDGNRIQPIMTTKADGSYSIKNIVLGTAKLDEGSKIISQATLNKLAQTGVPELVALDIQASLNEGLKLEVIRRHLASQFGQNVGYGYLDSFMSTVQSNNEAI